MNSTGPTVLNGNQFAVLNNKSHRVTTQETANPNYIKSFAVEPIHSPKAKRKKKRHKFKRKKAQVFEAKKSEGCSSCQKICQPTHYNFCCNGFQKIEHPRFDFVACRGVM
jgi:hypothetical protein